MEAITASPKRKADIDPAAPVPKHEEYGAVPTYLRERKDKWAVEEAERKKASEEAALCPPGHRLLAEEERLETLELLKKSAADTKDALSRMPLRVELPSALRKMQEMEDKLKKLEASLVLFSKPRVYVRIGA